MIYTGTYAGAHSCTGKPTVGCKALMAWFLARYAKRGARNDGIYNCRDVRGSDEVYSVHAEGRAADLGHPVGASWVGGLAEHLRDSSAELGIQCIISNRRIWSSKYPNVWRAYHGVDPHTGHIHVELTWPSARSLTVARIQSVLEDDVTPAEVKQAVTDALADFGIHDEEAEAATGKETFISIPKFLAKKVARRADVGYARDQLLAAVKAGMQAGPSADADAIVDEIATRLGGQS